MIHFVVASGSPRLVKRLAPRLAGALERTRLFDGEASVVSAPNGTWAVGAICVPDPFARERFLCDGDSFVLVNGVPTRRGAGTEALLRETLAAFASGGAGAVEAGLDGAYNFVGATPRLGLHACTDFAGLFPLYWRRAPGAVLFSNRPSTLVHASGGGQWDLRSLAWLIGHANLFGDRLPAHEVGYLLPGHVATVDPIRADVVVQRSPGWVWPAPHRAVRDRLGDDEWDEITELLVANVRALPESAPIRLMLSGGKDSRLCLAVAKAAGLRDRITCVTSGAARSPEFACAAEVAEVARFPHERARMPEFVLGGPGARAAYEWRRLHQHVYRYEAMVCPRDGEAAGVVGTMVSVKGFGGELYRGPGGHAKQFKRGVPGTVRQMADRFVHYHQRHDPLGILSPGEREFQARWLREWVHHASNDVRLDALPERFFVDYRLGHWNGPLIQWTPVDIKVNPLLSPEVARRYLELRPEVRATDRLHYEVMRRTAPELLRVPLVNDVWVSEIGEGSPIELPVAPFATRQPVNARTLRPGRWRFLDEARGDILALLDDADRLTDMGSVCDIGRLRSIVAEPDDLRSIDMKAVESSLAVAIALLGRAEPVQDEP